MLEDVYTARVRLENIFNKIKKINELGLDNGYLNKDLISIDKKFDDLSNFIPNSLSNTSTLAENSREIEKSD